MIFKKKKNTDKSHFRILGKNAKYQKTKPNSTFKTMMRGGCVDPDSVKEKMGGVNMIKIHYCPV